MRTMEELAKEALDVQDACNLSGVIHAWSRSITNLRELLFQARGQRMPDTDAVNTHPINKLFADKVAHLTGTQQMRTEEDDEITEAYELCKMLAEGVTV